MDIGYISETLKRELNNFAAQIKKCFSDKRGHEQSIKYITGLLSNIERKNNWQLAETQGEKTPYAIQ